MFLFFVRRCVSSTAIVFFCIINCQSSFLFCLLFVKPCYRFPLFNKFSFEKCCSFCYSCCYFVAFATRFQIKQKIRSSGDFLLLAIKFILLFTSLPRQCNVCTIEFRRDVFAGDMFVEMFSVVITKWKKLSFLSKLLYCCSCNTTLLSLYFFQIPFVMTVKQTTILCSGRTIINAEKNI